MLRALRDAGRAGVLAPPLVADAVTRTRALLAEMRGLRRDLRALRWVVQHFAR
jgi:hypothetical protein